MKETRRKKLPKLPPRKITTKGPKGTADAFKILSPAGGEIYKMYATYPTSQVGPCKFRVFWMGGPSGCDVTIWLIDCRRWVTIAYIAGPLSNVASGEIGMTPSWTLPADFHPTDEWTPRYIPSGDGPGEYLIYIEGGGEYAYGKIFNIVWSA